jgi:hypothetical protein
VKNAIDSVLIKNVYKIILKFVKEGKKMIEEGNKIIEEVNNMLPLWGDTYTKPKMIQKCNQMIKKGNKMIEESSKEHRCGWEKCRNCYEEVEILKHKCYMHDFFCFSVYP